MMKRPPKFVQALLIATAGQGFISAVPAFARVRIAGLAVVAGVHGGVSEDLAEASRWCTSALTA